MNKDEHYWTAMLLPQEHTNDELDYVVKRNCEKLALGLLDKLSYGKEYAVRIVEYPPALKSLTDFYVAEVRTCCTVREIVRCKDCIHHLTADCPMHFEYDPLDDWFCASGERK